MRVPEIVSKRMSSILTDPEKGLESGQSRGLGSSLPRDPHTQTILTEFRNYIGIQNDPDFETNRPIANVGIYQRIVKLEKQYKSQYQTFSWLINSALGLQIVFAAALTALGAGNGPRSAVTAFGALNTILAGFLTYLKGSGMPNRLKYYKDEVTKVREYIEQREREFVRGEMHIDLNAEVRIIEAMYDEMKRDIEVNMPEAYVSRTKQTIPPPATVDRYSSRARQEMDDRLYDTEERVDSLRRGVDSRLRDTRSGIDDRLSQARYGLESRLSQERLGLDRRVSEKYLQTRAGIDKEMNTARSGIDKELSTARAGLDRQISDARIATTTQVENTRQGIESRIEDTRSGLTAQVEDTRHGIESRLKDVQTQVKEQENKMMDMAERVAEKVLSVTQKRHEHDHK